MKKKLTIYDPETMRPLARTGSTQTSVLAAIEATAKAPAIIDRIWALSAERPFTPEEATAHLQMENDQDGGGRVLLTTVRARISGLRKAGRLIDSGERGLPPRRSGVRPPTAHGRRADCLGSCQRPSTHQRRMSWRGQTWSGPCRSPRLQGSGSLRHSLRPADRLFVWSNCCVSLDFFLSLPPLREMAIQIAFSTVVSLDGA